MKRLIAFMGTLFLAASPANASQADGVPIGVLASEYNVVFFSLNGTRSALPSCATSQPSRFVIDAATDGGRAMISALLTAQARGKRVFVNGTGTCPIFSDTENVNYLQIED